MKMESGNFYLYCVDGNLYIYDERNLVYVYQNVNISKILRINNIYMYCICQESNKKVYAR